MIDDLHTILRGRREYDAQNMTVKEVGGRLAPGGNFHVEMLCVSSDDRDRGAREHAAHTLGRPWEHAAALGGVLEDCPTGISFLERTVGFEFAVVEAPPQRRTALLIC